MQRSESFIKKFAELKELADGSKHILFVGETGSGKTTLHLQLLFYYWYKGHTILHRDDEGLEFQYLLAYGVPMNIFIPKECNLRIKEGDYDYRIHHFDHQNPSEIFETMKTSRRRFNVVVFDIFVKDSTQAIWLEPQFYFKLLGDFSKYASRRMDRTRIILSIDELDDIIPPRGWGSSEAHEKLIPVFEKMLRKLRKKQVTIIASTHRPTQLSKSARKTFQYKIVKFSDSEDARAFLDPLLIMTHTSLRKRIINDVQKMPQNTFYIFDRRGFYNKHTFPDLPSRPQIIESIEGEVIALNREKGYDEIDLLTAIMKVRGYSFRKIAEYCGVGKSTIFRRYQNLMDNRKIAKFLSEIRRERIR